MKKHIPMNASEQASEWNHQSGADPCLPKQLTLSLVRAVFLSALRQFGFLVALSWQAVVQMVPEKV